MENYPPESTNRSTDAGIKAGAESNNLSLVSLSMSVAHAEKNFRHEKVLQGPIGNSIDWLKNNLGASAQSSWMAGRAWSSVLNSDNGSDAVQKNIDADKAFMSSLSAAGSKDESHLSTNPKELTAKNSVEAYRQSQRQGVDIVSDVAALGGVMLTRRSASIAVAALEGAAIKSGTKYVDGAYSNITDDATSGALIGAGVPLAKAAGFVGVLGARMATVDNVIGLTAIKYGSEGAVLGYTQDVSARFSAARDAGLPINQAMSDSLIAPYKSKGALAGLGLGVGFGVLAGKVLAVETGYTGATSSAAKARGNATYDLSRQVSDVANPELLKDVRIASSTGRVPAKLAEVFDVANPELLKNIRRASRTGVSPAKLAEGPTVPKGKK